MATLEATEVYGSEGTSSNLDGDERVLGESVGFAHYSSQ